MANGKQAAWKWAKFVTVMAQLGLAVLLIVLVRYGLRGSAASAETDVCLLAPAAEWAEACIYADVVASISMVFTFLLSLMQLYLTSVEAGSISSFNCGKRCCGVQGQHIQCGLAGLAFCWWAAAAAILTHFAVQSNSLGMPRPLIRAGVCGCAWLSAALFCALLVAELLQTRAAVQAARAAAGRRNRIPYGSGFLDFQPPTSYTSAAGHQHSLVTHLAPAGVIAAAAAGQPHPPMGGMALGIPVLPASAPSSTGPSASAPGSLGVSTSLGAPLPVQGMVNGMSLSAAHASGSYPGSLRAPSSGGSMVRVPRATVRYAPTTPPATVGDDSSSLPSVAPSSSTGPSQPAGSITATDNMDSNGSRLGPAAAMQPAAGAAAAEGSTSSPISSTAVAAIVAAVAAGGQTQEHQQEHLSTHQQQAAASSSSEPPPQGSSGGQPSGAGAPLQAGPSGTHGTRATGTGGSS